MGISNIERIKKLINISESIMQLEVASSHRIHTGYDKMNIQLQRRLLYDLCYTC